jgi:hypothetical protein
VKDSAEGNAVGYYDYKPPGYNAMEEGLVEFNFNYSLLFFTLFPNIN